MKIIVCLDDRMGMMFNRRRQSRDAVVIEDINRLARGVRLWVHPYSEPLFPQAHISQDFLIKADMGEYCFVENRELSPYEEAIEEIVVYRWNRKYPADLSFDIDLEGWELKETVEFTGHSHEKITREIYRRKGEMPYGVHDEREA